MSFKNKNGFAVLVILAILLTVGLFSSSVSAQDNSDYTTVPLKFSELQVSQRDGTAVLTMEGCPGFREVGKPVLPAKSLTLAAPPDKEVSGVSIVTSNWHKLPGTYKVEWGQPLAPSDGSQPKRVSKDSKIYNSNSPYPEKLAEVESSGRMRKVSVGNMRINPVRYYPESGVIEVCSEMTVKVNYSAVTLPASERKMDKSPASVETLVDNPTQAEDWYSNPAPSADTADYVIITPNALTSAVTPIVTYKQSQGLTVNTTTTEWIYANCSGSDNQEKIRAFLKDRYLSWGIDYVLLVGGGHPDSGSVPMRKAYCPTGYSTSDDYPPTDYYYSDLSGNWDLNGDGKYGQYSVDDATGGVDFYPEVMVGRIPSDNTTTITAICNKIVSVSQNSGAWKHKVLIPGAISNFEDQPQDGYPPTFGGVWGDCIKNDIATPAGYSSFTMYEKTGVARSVPSVSPDPTACDQSLTQTNFINQFNSGYGVVTWWGHGNYTGAYRTYWVNDTNGDGIPQGGELSSPKFISNSDTLSNAYPAIVFQTSCQNGQPEYTNNLSTTMLTNGASAVVGGSRVTWYSVGWETPNYGGNATLAYLFTKQVVTNKHRVGKAIRMADLEYRNDYWGQSNYDYSNMYGFNFFGDPSMKLDADGNPTVSSVTPNNVENTGTANLTVSGTNFLDGATVKLTRTGYADVNATSVVVDSPVSIICSVPVDDVTYGQWNVVVTNPNNALATLTNGLTLYCPTPTVTGITPATGVSNQTVSITNLAGTNFRSTATVQLQKSGQTPINATNVVRESATRITCTIDLTGAVGGQWNVFVENGGGKNGIKTNAFTVSYLAPTIDYISPASGSNNNPSVYIPEIHGSNFHPTSVQLTKSGQTPITATGVNVSPDLTQIDCTFNLLNKAVGVWNVVVTNEDGQTATLSNGFAIEYTYPAITSITPNNGLNNGTVSITNLAGNYFRAGATVELTKTGEADIVASNVSVTQTSITCTFNLLNKPVGLWNVVVTNSDGKSATKVNAFEVKYPPPTISTITPSSGAKTGTVDITNLAGNYFRNGATVKLVGVGPEINATNVVVSATQITCTFDLADAPVGVRDLVVTNPEPYGASVTKTGCFTVRYPAPTVTGTTPNTGLNNGTVTVTNLAGTFFRAGATVSLTKTGQSPINATNVVVVSPTPYSTQITCTFNLNGKFVGDWNVEVTNDDTQTGTKTNGFRIEYPAPVINTISPNLGYNNNAAFCVTDLAGNYFRQGATVKLLKTGEEDIVGSINSLTATKITCTFNLLNKAVGQWNLVVTNDDTKEATKTNAFAIEYPAPTLTSITPDIGYTGATTQITDLKGNYFRSGATVLFTNATYGMVTPDNVVITTSKITCDVTFPTQDASLWDVVVTNDDTKGATLTNGFSLEHPAPTIETATPDHGVNTGTATVEIAGTGYFSNTTVKLTRTGQAEISAVVSNATTTNLTCYFSITEKLAGTWNVVVTNHDGKTATRTFTVENPAPDAGSITPANGYNNGTVDVQITGTNFRPNATVMLVKSGEENVYASVSVVTPTQIICSLNISGKAVGKWDVLVTNPSPGGGSDSLVEGFEIEYPFPAIGSVSHGYAKRQTTVNTSINGQYFRTGVIVQLRKGASAIDGSVASVGTTRIDVSFEVPDDAEIGPWDVYVENDDAKSFTKTGSFEVLERVIPEIIGIQPALGNNDQEINVTIEGNKFESGAYALLKKSREIKGTNVNVTTTRITCTFDLRNVETGSYDLTVQNPDGGKTLETSFTVTEAPVPLQTTTPTFYLAEGTTDYGFATYINIENPNTSPVTALVTYMTKTGPRTRATTVLPPMSQTVINPASDIGATDFSTKVECKEGKTICVDRRMIWTGAGAPSPEGHSSVGVTSAGKTWYLAEGSSKWGFETWLLIQNPNSKDAQVTITYMIEGQGPVPKVKTVPANSRASFSMETDIGQKDASIKVDSSLPVIPERAMYRNNRREGHVSIGTTTPAKNYYLAEGTTDWGFTTYVLVQNPNSKQTTINITYMTPAGPVSQDPFTMEANSRKTVTVNSVPGMSKTDCSIQVNGSAPIIAERAMYWGAGTPLGEACHDSIGMDSPHTTFYLPDGETQNGYETWTLVQNPNNTAVTVEISYLTTTGTGNVVFKETITANSRKSFSMADRLPNARASIMVSSKTPGKKIMCERAMYWNSRGAGTDTVGGSGD